MTDVLMPALSPTMEEGTLAKWHVKVGDAVKSGDVIAEIETDKATMEVEAVDEGVVEELLVPEGTEEVKVNTPIARLKGEGEADSLSPLRGGVFAAEPRDRRIDLHFLGPFRNQQRLDHAFVDRLDLHGRLVGLDLGDHVARADIVPHLHMPLGEGSLLHRGRQRRHQHVGHAAALSEYTSV